MSLYKQVAIRLMALSGLRASEVSNLDVQDVNLQEREIIIRRGKGNKDRLVFFDVTTQKVLAQYILQANIQTILIPASRTGQRINRRYLSEIVQHQAKAARIGNQVHAGDAVVALVRLAIAVAIQAQARDDVALVVDAVVVAVKPGASETRHRPKRGAVESRPDARCRPA